MDAALVRDAKGLYHLVQLVDQAGTWNVLWTATGAVEAILKGDFIVSSGPETVTITVQDSLAVPIPGAVVGAFKPDLSVAGTAITGVDGKATFSLSDGEYSFETALTGWRFPVADLNVAGVSTLLIVGTNLAIVATKVLSLCRLFGYIVDPSGRGLQGRGSEVIVEPVGSDLLAFVDTVALGLDRRNVGVVKEARTIRPRVSDGFWEIELIQGMVVRLHIPALQFERIFTVPKLPLLNMKDIRPLPGAAQRGLINETSSSKTR
jgi:hypothetical protein